MKTGNHKKKILATSWHPGGARAILPVIKKLTKDGSAEVIVVGHEFSEPIFSQAGIAFQTIKDFGLQDVSVESMVRLLDMVSPNLVFVGTAGQEGKKNDVIEQTITLAARKRGIVSLAVLDYWANYQQRFSDERTEKNLDILPDRIAIMDGVAKEDMLKQGFPEEILVITGNPHFDDLSQKAKKFSEEQRKQVRKDIGFPAGVLYFLACNVFSCGKSTYGYWDLDTIELVSTAISSLPDVGVVIRLHPRTPDQDKQKIREFIGQSTKIKLDEDVDAQKSQTLALSADLTVVEDSTTGIEAVYMKRPCISIQPELLIKDSLIVSERGIIPVGYNPKDCIELLRKAVNPAFRAQITEQYSRFVTDGKATERVTNLVYSLLN